MRHRTHLLLTYVIVAHLWDPKHALAAALGSLLPDLDHPSSVASQALVPLEKATLLPLRRLINTVVGHRGILHWPVPWAFGAFLAWWIGHTGLAAVLLGGCLHCLEDALTVRGVPLLVRRDGGRWRVWNLRLTPVPSDKWDAVLPPATVLLLCLVILACPSEFHTLGLDRIPGLEKMYWTVREHVCPKSLHPFDAHVGTFAREILRLEPMAASTPC
ncbi:metal-dependent hydrolase [Methanopyrus kandleri]